VSAPTIYIVDGETSLVEVFSDAVESIGLKHRGFPDSKDFLEVAADCDADDILILDLQMPGMDGVEVMRHLASRNITLSLILISGHDASVLASAEKLCKAHGMKIIASISKPVHIDLLLRTIQDHAGLGGIESINKSALRKDDLVQYQRAIEQKRLQLQFQPQIDIASGKLCGLEALVRMRDADNRDLDISKAIPVIECTESMTLLTDWVLAEAIGQLSAWQKKRFEVPVSVNLSATDITCLSLPETMLSLLDRYSLDPSMITLELTETALMDELSKSLDTLTRLRLKGIGLSIDDFGTGYSSLSQLHRAPFTELKIDRSFVSHMNVDMEARGNVKTCIMLGHELNLKVVAEGVESREHLELLKAYGCDVAQGYYVSRPMAAEEVLAWASRTAAGNSNIVKLMK